jgi:hypothetical protein
LSSEPLRVLHLISRPGDRRAWACAVQGSSPGPLVVLIHDAVMETPGSVAEYLVDLGAPRPVLDQVVASGRDASRRRVGDRWPTIDYQRMVQLMAEADRVISW